MNSIGRFKVASRRRHRAVAMMFPVVAFIGLSACTPVTAPPPPEEGVTEVDIKNFAFVPKEVRIKVGESVRWTNLESGPARHTSTSGSPGATDGLWDSGSLSPGESFTRKFEDAGEFVYFCTIHRTMAAMRDAKVIVEP